MRCHLICLSVLALLPALGQAHTSAAGHDLPMDKEVLRQHILDEFMAKRVALGRPEARTASGKRPLVRRPVEVGAGGAFNLAAMLATGATVAIPGNGELMAASFAPFKPKVRYWWDGSYFYEESDGIPDRTRQPNLMVGITSWQQQVPLPVSYFASTTNGTNNSGSLGYQQPNVWKIPLVPVPAAAPISLTGNFLRGAVALGSDGVPIFNPRNNTGQFSYAIGELDAYGGHCGLGDDYHYHLFPVHLTPVLGNDKPIAWGLDGYPVYGYVEPDGSTMQVLDADGGHDHGNGWGYHYHARGTYNAGTGAWTPASPYMMSAMHGAVVNFDSQIDPQPTASGLRASGTGGYTAQPVAGAVITAFKNPVALSTDGSGHLVENVGGVASEDQWLMRYTVSSTTYDICWRLNRNVTPRTMTITWRHPTTGTTTTTYNNVGGRITTYPMAGPSMMKIPDTSQTLDATATFGEDSDYSLNPQSFTSHGNGTTTDNVTGLMWQSTDNGESTWENAVANAAAVTTGGHADWRLPTPAELFSLFTHQVANPALSTVYFPNHPSGAAEYWWSSDLYGTGTTNVWCGNAGGGLGPKPKTETISAGGALRYHARYVRGARPSNGHNYCNNNNGTITDLDTGLMWTQVPSGSLTWANALTYAEGLTTGGFGDWRLPNVKELQTLTDYTLATFTTATGIKPSLHRQLFPAAAATSYWTSTSQNNNTANAWMVEFGLTSSAVAPRNAQGIISQEVKTANYPAFAVRTASLVQTDIAVTENGAALTDGVSTVNYGSVNVGTAATKTFTISNNGTSSLSITGVTIDGVDSSSFSVPTQPVLSIQAGGSATFSASFNALSVGNRTAVLHITSSDVGTPSFDIYLTGLGTVPPPTISNISVNPISPASTDSPVITAQVIPSGGGSISGVTLTYDLGAQVTANVFRESFAMASSTNWNGTGGLTTWTTAGAGATRQANLQSNRTTPVVLTNCTTTGGSTSVGCTSTASLWPNMIVTGAGMPAGAVISSITNGTTFVISVPAATSSATASLTANGITLSNCSTTAASTTVTCDSTIGLIPGMGLAGTGLANNATVSSITNATTFVMSAAPTTPGNGLTLTGNGNALEFQAASASLTTAMATSPTINAAGTAGSVDFYVQTRDMNSLSPNNQWAFQVSPDGGTTWNTRLTEDWSGSTVNLTNVVTNSTGNSAGSTTVSCASTAGLTTGRSVSAPAVYVTGNTTSGSAVVTNTTTSSLQVGMFVTSTGTTIPNNTRILTIDSATQFTMSAPAAATTTTAALAGNYFPANATVNSITNTTTFVLGTAAFVNTTAAPISAFASTVNHGFITKGDGAPQPYHYVLDSSERSANMRMRFQYAGGTATAPARAPRVSIDDIVVNTTSGAPPTTVTMHDDGAHGDGAANDGTWGAAIPAQPNGSTVNFSIAAAGGGGSGTTTSGATSYVVAPAPAITTPSPLPAGNTLGAYSQALAATGGSGTGYVWSLSSGTLPTGLALSAGGVLSGTPTAAGNFSFTVEVTDSASRSATKSFTLAISAQTRPNVVIIITDDQGWGDVGYHTPVGQVPIQTPNMDSFGTTLAGSIRLERFYATTVCSVTRSTLATGRSPIRHATNNVRGVPLSEHMMPQTFKAAGYQTFMCGKWHNGGSDKNIHHFTVNGSSVRFIQEGLQYAPYNRGWDSHYGQYSGAIDYFTHRSAEAESLDIPDWWFNGVQQDGAAEHADSRGNGGWSPTLLADKAISHIQNRDPSKPMLLHVAFNSIHGPVSAPPSLITKYTSLGITNNSRRLIAAAVDGMDQEMGRILAALDAAGIANNTVVVWFGDNGGDETKGSLNDPLRGTKGDSYDGGLREVAGIRWPGVLAAAGPVISNQYLWVGDLFPTLAAAVGVTPQNTKPLDGVNMWSALLAASPTTSVSRGTPLVTDQASPVSIYQFADPVNGGVKDFKLIRSRVGSSTLDELFNLTDDPYETSDLLLGGNAVSYSGIVTTLTNAITSIPVDNNPPYVGPPMITNTVPQGGTITLYAPFTSYKAPAIQWRKGGVAVSGGVFTQITDSANATVSGSYAATLTLSNVSPAEAGSYDVVITNVGGTAISDSGVLTVTFGAPVLDAMPAFTKGTSQTVTWSASAGATSYTIQSSTTPDFASILSSQTVSTTAATFSGLASGTRYYYRANATDGANTSVYSSAVSSMADAGSPVITITSPANNAVTGLNTVNVQGTASDIISPITGVLVNGTAATTADGYAHWSVTVPLNPGTNTIAATANDSADEGGNSGAASITVTFNATGPTITGVSTGPTSPTYLDPTYVTAAITPAAGTTVSRVQIEYDTGTPVSTKVWQETFANTSSNNWNGIGALNAWTTVGAGNVRQAVSTSNHTAISITAAATTSGSTTVTCASTANLWPGMLITGPNIPGSVNGAQAGNTTVASITSSTAFLLSQPASGSGTGLTLTAAGVTLTNAVTTAASTVVTCDSTAGLVNGMSLSGTGMANNATVASVTSGTSFAMNVVPTTPGSALTLSATTAAAEFNGGTANLADSMFATSSAVNTSGASGFVEFWVQTRDLFATNNCGWSFQVSADNGVTWNTRLSEDWNSETGTLSNVVLNPAGAVGGNVSATCADTTGLTVGRSLVSAPVNVTAGITSGSSTATCANTAGLVPGMFVAAAGIPNNTRIGAIVPNTSFTLVTGATASLVNATATSGAAAAAATHFAANATISSITNPTTFVMNVPAYANTGSTPLGAVFATTVNHGFQLFHYDLGPGELSAQTKLRFQAAGYVPSAPTRSPRISIDDITVGTTAPPPTITVTMFDDGNHGDGAANDGIWGAPIPPQTGGTTINFKVVATDGNSASSTSPAAGSYIYTVNNLLTDATILGAEFLTLPRTDGITVNLIASADQMVFVEYGTQPGKYTNATTPALFTVDASKPEFKNPIRIPITGLQQDTEYYYRVRHKAVAAPFYNIRGERSFHTARPRGTTFTFTVTADPHIDVNTDMQLFWRAMANISADAPDLHIDVGDIFMTDKLADGLLGVPPRFKGGFALSQATLNERAIFFRNQFERACHSIPFFFGLGNHEAEYGYLFNAATDKQNNIPAWDLKARKAFYPAPTPDSFYTGNPTPKDYTGGTLGLLEDYYAFEWGDSLFVMLDPFWNTLTNPNSGNDAWHWTLGKAQYDWLRDTLRNSSARYKFVFMHHIVGGSTQAIINGVPTPQFAARGGIEVSDKYEWGGKNTDGSEGFAAKRPGWDMPVHNLLVQNKVNIVFHGHDHLYGYQTKDGVVYLECPQPGTANYSSLGSAADGQYVDLGANSSSQLLPNSGHIRVTVGPDQAVADYVRSYRTSVDPMPPDATSIFNDETSVRHNKDVSHSFVLAPRVFPPMEIANIAPGQVGLRWNAVPNKPCEIQWSTDLVNWTTIETRTFTNTYTNATYTDTLPARVNGQRAFYRVRWVP